MKAAPFLTFHNETMAPSSSLIERAPTCSPRFSSALKDVQYHSSSVRFCEVLVAKMTPGLLVAFGHYGLRVCPKSKMRPFPTGMSR